MTSTGLCLKETFTLKSSQLQHAEALEFTDKELSFKVYESVAHCEEYWDQIRCEDPFYSPEYFKVLESKVFHSAKPLYAFVFLKDEEEPFSFFYLQKKRLDLMDSIDVDQFKEGSGFWAKMKYRLQKIFFPLAHFDLMVAGNVLLTGKYGFRGCHNKVETSDYEILARLLKNLRCKVRKTDYRFSVTLIKDFFEEEKLKEPNTTGFAEMQFDPSMVLNIRPDWSSFEDYLLDMKSKHRVRTKKHLKNGETIKVRTLSQNEVVQLDSVLVGMYDSVISTSGFNMARIENGYFAQMAQSFQDQFFIDGMYHDSKLVGFYSYMIKNDALLSHFIGYDEDVNREHSIYMNILLGLIKNAIDLKVKELFYYRTALEIKSSVGAEPRDMYCYLVHHNPVVNLLVRYVIKTFFPKPVWTPRSPFKNSDNSDN
jgi:hypothetical protein